MKLKKRAPQIWPLIWPWRWSDSGYMISEIGQFSQSVTASEDNLNLQYVCLVCRYSTCVGGWLSTHPAVFHSNSWYQLLKFKFSNFHNCTSLIWTWSCECVFVYQCVSMWVVKCWSAPRVRFTPAYYWIQFQFYVLFSQVTVCRHTIGAIIFHGWRKYGVKD